jgi:predicted membrane-bound mannosyltransferase
MYKSNLPEYEQIILMFCLAMIPVIVATGRTFRPAYQQFCIAFVTTTIVF